MKFRNDIVHFINLFFHRRNVIDHEFQLYALHRKQPLYAIVFLEFKSNRSEGNLMIYNTYNGMNYKYIVHESAKRILH